MHNHYIINGLIEFHPAASTLRNLNDPEEVVVLNSPAGRCLLLLIQRAGEIVTQHEFMKIVWEKNGMLVTPNTFYQNISILRKGLKKIGLPEDPVMTIPRVGLTLTGGTQIKKRSSEKLVEISHEHTHFMDENSLTQDVSEQDGLMQTLNDEELEPPSAKPATPLSVSIATEHIAPVKKARLRKSSYMLLAAMGLVAMILLAAIVSLNYTHDDDRTYFSEYLFLANTSGCHVFIADKNATPDEKIKTLSLIDKFKPSCNNYPWVYVTHYFMLPRISVIRCNKQMKEPNACISEYYFKGLKQGD